MDEFMNPKAISLMTFLAVAAVCSMQAQAQQAGGTTRNTAALTTGGGGGTAGAQIPGNVNTTGEIQTDAGTSANVMREFNEGFVGRADNTSRFVGNENAEAGGNVQRNFQNRQSSSSGFGTWTRTTSVRPTMQLGFQPPVTSGVSTVTLQTPNLNAMQRYVPFQMLNVMVDEGTAVVNGTVASERERKLAEALLRLEPGIRRVDNQLKIRESR